MQKIKKALTKLKNLGASSAPTKKSGSKAAGAKVGHAKGSSTKTAAPQPVNRPVAAAKKASAVKKKSQPVASKTGKKAVAKPSTPKSAAKSTAKSVAKNAAKSAAVKAKPSKKKMAGKAIETKAAGKNQKSDVSSAGTNGSKKGVREKAAVPAPAPVKGPAGTGAAAKKASAKDVVLADEKKAGEKKTGEKEIKAKKKAEAPMRSAPRKISEAPERPASPAVVANHANVEGKSSTRTRRKEDEVSESTGEDDEIVLTDADGRRYCRVKDCDQAAAVDGYCRYHYLLYWKNIQVRKKILSEGKLSRYIEELTARYPDRYLEMLRKDLRNEKDFLAAIQELEIDDSSNENEFEDEAQSYLDEVRGMSSEVPSRDEDEF